MTEERKEEDLELAEDLEIAWMKYTNSYGQPPHGTLKQIHAMLAFMPHKYRKPPADAKFPEKKKLTAEMHIQQYQYGDGWNACHAQFTEALLRLGIIK